MGWIGNSPTLGNFTGANLVDGTVMQADLEGSLQQAIGNATQHIQSTTNPHGVTKAQVGLGNVDNTTDLLKPIQTATQSALNAKLNVAAPSYTGGLTGDTGVINIGSGQLYKDASGNVGVGAASTGAKVFASATAAGFELKQSTSGAATYYVMDNTVESGGKRWRFGYTGVGAASTFSLYNSTDNATAWIVDTSGNLGLGVTPKAWSTGDGFKAIDVASTAGASFAGNGSSAYVANRLVRNSSGWRYSAAGAASLYGQNGEGIGGHQWYVSTSAPAVGNDPVLSLVMTLDASGNLGLGMQPVNSDTRLRISGVPTNGTAFPLRINNGNYAVGYATLLGIGVEASSWQKGAIGFVRTGSYDVGDLVFCLNNDNASGSDVSLAYERARLDSNGRFMVAATSSHGWNADSPGWNLLNLGGSRQMAFNTHGGSIAIRGDSGGWGMGLYAYGSSNTHRGGFGFLGGGDSLSYYWVGTAYNGTGVQLSYNSTSWTALSDEREKTIHGEIENGLSKVLALAGIYFNYNTDAEDTPRRVGFSAQRVRSVFPEAVQEIQRDIENPTEDTKRLALSSTELIPLLVNAIKEQQSIIENLNNRLIVLEGQ